MRCCLTLFAALLLSACGVSPDRTLVTRSDAPYSLAEADGLPKALRLPLRFEDGFLFVSAEVDGERVGPMLLDTGSTLNIIDKGVVARLGLKQVGKGRTIGIAGPQSITQHAVGSLVVGGLDLGVDRAASLSMYRMTRGLSVSPAGIVGSVSLLPHPFTIDYGQEHLTIHQRKTFVPPKDAEQVRLAFYGRLPAVRATLGNGKEVLLIIDTGMDSAVALPMEVSRWPGVLATGASGAGASAGVGGRVQTTQGWLKELNVFGYRLSGVPVTFEPRVEELSRADVPVGRIGGQLLRGFVLTFEGNTRRLWAAFSSPE